MKKILKNLILLALSLITVFSLICNTGAINTTDAKADVDVNAPCSLTLTYEITETKQKLSGLEIQIFYLATVSEDYEFALSDAFKDYALKVNKLKTQAEWDTLTATALSYIVADKIQPTLTRVTNENGMVKFSGLKCGVYLVRWTGNETEHKVSGFVPYSIVLPNLDEKGEAHYDVDAYPKPGELNDTYTEYKLVIQWKGDYVTGQKPDVIVDIYKNSEIYAAVRLNDTNNWTYSWVSGEHDTWNVVERSVPIGCTVTTEQNGHVFVVTNYYSEEQAEIDRAERSTPQTGVTDNTFVLIMIIAGCGTVMLLIGIIGRRRKNA